MKKIILPIDFSIFSEHALKVAAMLAKKYSSKITIVHMIELPLGYSNHDENYSKTLVFTIKYAENKINELLDKDYLKGITTKVIIKHFTVFSEIGDLAIEEAAELIVMGSHGVDNDSEFFLGTNTERVIKNTKIPVLIIKDELSDVNFEKTIFVSNFKEEIIPAYQKAQKLYKLLDIQPTLLYINKPGKSFLSTNEMKKRIAKFLMKADNNLDNLDNFKHYDDYSIEEGVKSHIIRDNTSLITIPTHGKSNIEKFFKYSSSYGITNKSVRTVMTILI